MNFRDLQSLAREMRNGGRAFVWVEMAEPLWEELKASSGQVPPRFPSLPVSLLDGVPVILVPVQELHDPRGWRLVVRRHRRSVEGELGPEIVVASGTGFEPVHSVEPFFPRIPPARPFVPPLNNPKDVLKGITGL